MGPSGVFRQLGAFGRVRPAPPVLGSAISAYSFQYIKGVHRVEREGKTFALHTIGML